MAAKGRARAPSAAAGGAVRGGSGRHGPFAAAEGEREGRGAGGRREYRDNQGNCGKEPDGKEGNQ